ncbi:MAG TPA: glycosyltransferase family 2 protein [Brevibacterium sp.]|nr:glycosyltransferase family 2 protein [Brevibacterium sp.]
MTPVPTVSVIVPTRDRPGLLHEAIESVIAQTSRDWECLVIDDAGEVELPQVDDGRVRFIRNETSRGPGGARNRGLAAATGQYVCFLDDDDRLPPTALESLVAAARPDTIVFGQWTFVGSVNPVRPHRLSGSHAGTLIDATPPLWTGIYPRVTCCDFDEGFRTGQDIEFLFRMSLTHEVLSIPDLVYEFRKHDGTRIGVHSGTRATNRLKLIEKHHEWYARHPRSHARQLARAAAAAYLAGDFGSSQRLAIQSLRRGPNQLALKLLGRSSFALIRGSRRPVETESNPRS